MPRMMPLTSPPLVQKRDSGVWLIPVSLNYFRNFYNHSLALLSREDLNPLGCPHMSSDERDLRSTIARHEREIDELQEHVKVLEDGHMKERVEAEIAKKMTHLEADLRLQELQETMVNEEAAKHRKRGFFRRN
jgi:hypothetical protein